MPSNLTTIQQPYLLDPVFDFIALRALTVRSSPNQLINLVCGNSLNDGYGGLFSYDVNSISPDDNTNIIKPNSNNGRWIRVESASGGGGGSGVEIAAGTSIQSTGIVHFNNANGVSFGLSNGTMTASVNSGVNYVLVNSNGLGWTTSGSSVFGSYSTIVTAGLISGVNISAGTTSNNLTNFVFSNSNNVSFGLSGSTITGSFNQSTQTFPTQTTQTQNVVVPSAGTQTATSGTVVFSNSNGISFGMSGSSRITASYTVPSTAGLISAVNVSAGSTSNNLTALTFSNINGVSFGLNGSVITGSVSQSIQPQTSLNYSNANGATFGIAGSTLTLSYTVPSTAGLLSAIKVSAGTQSSNLSAITLSNSNGLAFGLSNGTITASYTVPSTAGLISNINISGGTTSSNVNSIVFSNANNFSFGLSNNTITASYTVPSTVGLISGISVTAGGSNQFLTQLQFSNANGIAFGLNATAISASLALNVYAVSNSTVSSSGTVPAQSLSIIAQNGAYAGISGNQIVFNALKGLYYNRLNAQVVNYVLVKGDEGAIIVQESGSAITITVPPDSSVAWQQQRITVYNDAGGQITIVAGAGVTLNTTSTLINTKKFGFIYLDYIGPNEWSVSGDLVGAYAINVSAGTTNSNATNFSFANSNNMSFGINGQTITGSFSQSTLPPVQNSNNFYNQSLGAFQLGNNLPLFQPFVNPGNLSFTNIAVLLSNSYGTSNATFNGTIAFAAGIYSRNGGTIFQVTSGSTVLGFTGSGTNLSSIFGGGANIARTMTIPINVNITPGNYWLGIASSFTVSTLTNILSISAYGPNQPALVLGQMGAATNNTVQFPIGYGFLSATTSGMPGSVAFSQLTGNLSPRLNYGYEFRNY